MTMDFTVASTYKYIYSSTGSTGQYSNGAMVTPAAIIPWMQVWSSKYGASDSGTVWFADAQLTIS
jgi:hypothetical protein